MPDELVVKDDLNDAEKAAAVFTIDRVPQVGEDGRLRVSDEISEQAEEHGFAPDIQPRAQPAGGFMVTGVVAAGSPPNTYNQADDTASQLANGTDADRQAAAESQLAQQQALARLEAPLSVRVALEAEEVGVTEEVAPAPEPTPTPATPPTFSPTVGPPPSNP